MTCFACGKIGHFKGSHACKHRPRKSRGQARRVASGEREADSPLSKSSRSTSRSSSATSSPPPDLRNRAKKQTGNSRGVHRVNLRKAAKSKDKRPRYQVHVIVKEQEITAFADTGADVNVMSSTTANKLQLPLMETQVRVKPYGSRSLKCLGSYEGCVTFGDAFAVAKFYVVDASVETLLSGKLCEALGIIKFNAHETFTDKVIHRIVCKDKIKQSIINSYPSAFRGIGTLRNYQVHFYVDPEVAPVAQAARPIPFHIRDRFEREIQLMKEQDVIEEHHGPAPWVSNPVISPKDNGGIRITVDLREVNKAIKSTNIPIPRVEDIKIKLSGCKVFSKLDFKSAFHQLELDEDSRQLTVFHAGTQLMRYKRLVMGAKPASGELSKALMPVFGNIDGCHVIHDDLVVAGRSLDEHNSILSSVMDRIQCHGLTLNPEKCIFRKTEIPFWGMIVSSEGIKPDPSKIQALQDASPPQSKEDVMSFLCFVQSFSDFIPQLSKRTQYLRKLTKKHKSFRWTKDCEKEFIMLKNALKEKTLLTYYNQALPTFIFVDAHNTGLSAILAQGKSADNCKAVAYASRATRDEETRYPQLDLEAVSIDFALRRFRSYVAGGPQFTVITDHKPLVSIFANTRKGSIRTDRIKLRHQDLSYVVQWQPGNENCADFLSRHATPFQKVPREWQKESQELEKTVWMLQYSPYTESISMHQIIQETAKDPTLERLKKYIQKGYIPKSSQECSAFKKVFSELTIVDNMIMKSSKIVLPERLRRRAVRKAHQGGHPGMNSLKRRIRSHFWFPGINEVVEEAVKSCKPCQMFTNKTTSEPIKPIPQPKSPWQDVSIDLFGPMPDRKHVVVIQDIKTRFPAASIVNSTSASHVIPAIEDVYTAYGKPDSHRTDNGPPFNSKEFAKFSQTNAIEHRRVFPYHPQANPVETFMKPLGKALKVANWERQNKQNAINNLLTSYRSTPHPATGETPGNLMFRGGYKQDLSRKVLSSAEVTAAFQKDQSSKNERADTRNKSTHCKPTQLEPGDLVLLRNTIRNKFDPLFGPQMYKVISTQGSGAILQRLPDGKIVERHCNDIKLATYEDASAYSNTQKLCFMWTPPGAMGNAEFLHHTANSTFDEIETDVQREQGQDQQQRELTPTNEADTNSTQSQDTRLNSHSTRIPRALKQLQDFNKPGYTEMGYY